MNRRTPSIIALTILSVILTIPVYPQGHSQVVTKTRILMGTIVEIKVPLADFNSDPSGITHAIDKAFDEMARIDRVFSIYKDDSELSRLNARAGRIAVPVSDELFALIEKAVRYNSKTKGVFDITIKPLRDLWENAHNTGRMPDEAAIAAASSKVGSQMVKLDRAAKTIGFAKEGMSLDLGGIAKGYAVDRAVKVLKANGISNAIVHAGGDMYCLGSRPDAAPWNIAIQHPRDKSSVVYELAVRDKGVDTSGDYERFFVIDGRRYSHIIDPRSGMPIGDDVVSATVIADDSTTGDIFSTAVCILGQEGLRIAEEEGLDALIIIEKDGRFETYTTKGFETKYDITKKNF